jgi:formylglycine-generating enzyme required for sulfatase activity
MAKTASNVTEGNPVGTPSSPASSPPSSIQTALDRARVFNGQRNADWQAFVTTFPDLKIPDMPFCLVPTGTFQMGSDDGHDNDETPVHPQTIERPYWIAQYPVTNAQWAEAVKAGAVPEPLEAGGSLKWYKDKTMAAAPVVGVTWLMASDFAAWVGCRLPTELEWEYAARGVESLRYPWGDDWDDNIPVWDKNSGGKPAVVTTKAEGKSWINAWHMIGNVWEWTSSLYERYPYQREDGRELHAGNSTDVRYVLRGGSWRNGFAGFLHSVCRVSKGPDLWDFILGFRLARSL